MADFIRIALSVLVPPVGVFLKVGFGGQFWLNLLLTLLFYIPGLCHAVYVIASEPDKAIA
ncbi:YqaE/Pmp3 family membrane protein [Mariniblastus fucicola]|uniref:Proteolipid membrane potential modulator n=1 Tax=Mariniblastus fucicola TaxID=980251 RepID=A0A5B9PEJ2_9BACT|nr:YqaE/Pmp3 family membrane protein [Mariniblastus fucicola]QEG24664.1 Proteolipid membrane potential modulator [Mariniblastus fucicola]